MYKILEFIDEHSTAILISIILIIIVGLFAYNHNDQTYNITVTKMEEHNDKYLIFCKDASDDNIEYVFQDTDTLFRLKYNSSDIYNHLKVGKSYTITVVGHRIRFLSTYKNIINVKDNE